MPDKPTLFLLCGLPGAGKSTYAGKLFETEAQGALVLSSDEIRSTMSLNQPYLLEAEHFVWAVIEAYTRGALRYGRSVIIDATNLNRYRRGIYMNLALDERARVECHYVKVELEESIKRSAKWIPRARIEEMNLKFEEPDENLEFFHRIVVVPQEPKPKRGRGH